MRRLAPLLATLALAAACAPPEIRLTPRFRSGEARTYRLDARADTRIRIPGTIERERARIAATTRVEVVSASAAGTRLRLVVRPTLLVRDDVRLSPPPQQEAVLDLAPDGALRAVRRVGGLPPELATDATPALEEIAPLLGASLPPGRVHIGTEWTRAFPDGRQRGRVTALRVVRGRDCAVLALQTERRVQRRRVVGDVPLQLAGREVAATEAAHALSSGLPVAIESAAHATLAVTSGGVPAGSVTIESRLSLALERVEGG